MTPYQSFWIGLTLFIIGGIVVFLWGPRREVREDVRCECVCDWDWTVPGGVTVICPREVGANGE